MGNSIQLKHIKSTSCMSTQGMTFYYSYEDQFMSSGKIKMIYFNFWRLTLYKVLIDNADIGLWLNVVHVILRFTYYLFYFSHYSLHLSVFSERSCCTCYVIKWEAGVSMLIINALLIYILTRRHKFTYVSDRDTSHIYFEQTVFV